MSTHVRTALISTAGHCKVACGFCFRADRAHGFLDIATYARTLSRLKEAGVEGVCLSGGEPVHHPQLRQLVRLAHQFGLSVSMVTSARTVSEVITLSQVAHLLANVTVSADSRGAMLLGRTTRTTASAVDTLRAVHPDTKILHVTCWALEDEECRELVGLVSGTGIQLQFSPLVLDERALSRADTTLREYLERQRLDARLLGRHFDLSGRYRAYLDELRTLQLPSSAGDRRECRSETAYVSADGRVRRCPYGRMSIGVHAPRAEINAFLVAPARDRVTPDCAAICRSAVPADDGVGSCATPA
ncbi:radical SAM protein [Streptomyces sp. NPDC058953]|uniref:radical SAM protein n=1 Tax=unclassified Streptomyces TaxID=2593676 RepID=UPI00369C6C89